MRIIAIAWMFVGLGCAEVAGDVVAAPFQLIGEDLAARSRNAEAETAERQRQEECHWATGRSCEAPEATAFRREREAAEAHRADARALTEAEAASPSLPETLDSTMISQAVAIVKPRVMACGDGAKGQVIVSVKVAANGHVIAVTVNTTPEPGLGDCVVAVVTAATFARTQRGGSFRYPFLF